MISQKEAEPLNNAYAPLWDLMNQEHNKVLLISELDEIIAASNKVQENLAKLSDEPQCLDCGMPYYDSEMLDCVLSNDQWKEIIHPQEDGILCGNCILKRAKEIGYIQTKLTLHF